MMMSLIMEASSNLRYCGCTRLMGFIQASLILTFGCEIELTLDVLVTVCWPFLYIFFIFCSCHILVRFALKAGY